MSASPGNGLPSAGLQQPCQQGDAAGPRLPQSPLPQALHATGGSRLVPTLCQQDKNIGTGFERRRGIFTRAGSVR